MIMKNKFFLAGISLILLVIIQVFLIKNHVVEKKQSLWELRSVDTVKYSRDLTGQMLERPEFDEVIEKQVADIASTGASHIALGSPYDAQYVPFLERWVKIARKHKLKVWFRGNFSGWEKWFNYEKITRDDHKRLLEEFILNNPDLFEDGDIFTSCPECENGGPGDPRQNGDVLGHRQFLIDEYNISLKSFGKINKKVNTGFYSMNYDVAKLIMDKPTTQALGGIVSIDHYVKDPKKVAKDAKEIALTSGGKVVLGEFGAPIPDINGDLSEIQQNQWIEEALKEVKNTPEIIGVNYWVNVGGSTRLWNEDGTRRLAADTIAKFYNETIIVSSP